MPIRYFYEVDCLNLNRGARLYYPLPYRLSDFIQKKLSVMNIKLEKYHEAKEIKEKILTKLNAIKREINWEQDLFDASFVVFDCETTGLQPFKGDKVISLSGVVIEKGVLKTDKVFNKFINPLRHIPPLSTEITGITNSMVSGAPTLFEVLPEFLDFIGSRILVAHCAPFDLAFLNIELGRYTSARILNPVIDTYLLAQTIFPEINDYSLDNLLKKFNLEIKGRHTALGDSLMTARLFLKLQEKLSEKEIFTLDQLQRFLSINEEKALTHDAKMIFCNSLKAANHN